MFNYEIVSKLYLKELNDKIKNLESKVEMLDRENRNLDSDLSDALYAIQVFENEIQRMPKDCKLGPWCAGCYFSKPYYIVRPSSLSHLYKSGNTMYYCAKSESCSNFVQRQEEST